jgi:hypothetical protein
MSEIKCIKGGIAFRLFASKADALSAIHKLPKTEGQSFHPLTVKGTNGFVVVSQDGKQMLDHGGSIPSHAIKLFKNSGQCLEWTL